MEEAVYNPTCLALHPVLFTLSHSPVGPYSQTDIGLDFKTQFPHQQNRVKTSQIVEKIAKNMHCTQHILKTQTKSMWLCNNIQDAMQVGR